MFDNEIAKEKLSNTVAKKILDGKMNHPNGFKTGWFESRKNANKIFYRSSYELAAYRVLEEMDSVISFQGEPLKIPYTFEGKTRNYVPDLLVLFNDGRSKLIEIKPSYLHEDDCVLAKQRAAEEFCAARNMSYDIWDESKISAGR